MTLSVSAYRRNKDGSEVNLPLPSDLAGFESTRCNFYGSEQSIKLGLKLLPTLKDFAFLHVGGEELPVLLAEINILLESLPTGPAGEYWRFRLNNIRTAVQCASMYGQAGYVVIG